MYNGTNIQLIDNNWNSILVELAFAQTSHDVVVYINEANETSVNSGCDTQNFVADSLTQLRLGNLGQYKLYIKLLPRGMNAILLIDVHYRLGFAIECCRCKWPPVRQVH